MPRFSIIIIHFAAFFLCGIPSARSATHFISAARDGAGPALQAAISVAADGDLLLLDVGIFRAEPREFVDSLCGNCEEHRTLAWATAGFIIRGKRLTIVGSGARESVLETAAGYGVYIEGCPGVLLRNLVVTGGVRDPDGRATDAAVVVRRSLVAIEDCLIMGNTARIDSVVVGIAGIVGREGADLVIERNEIRNNGWDGVALYRGARAVITGNTIVEGRGAGIGVTWDATATVSGNRVSGYWKGIGAFGESRITARGNTVFDNLGWGIIATGTAWLDASNNVVWHNGNCGVAVWSATCTARFTNNVVARNGWRKEWVCPCVGAWMESPNPRAEFSYNDVWGNEAGGYSGLEDPTGRDGNLSIDPGFVEGGGFRLPAGSPLRNVGNPLIADADGTRSDIGLPPLP